MFRMRNPVKAYAWGDPCYLAELLGIEARVLAELWMGAHPTDPSRLIVEGEERALDQYLETAHQAPLPFLFKVLAAAAPLSIQVHPSQTRARQGFARENAQGLKLWDPRRNYKDDNHKPEMLYALTTFEALCGFRDYAEIIDLLDGFGLHGLLPGAGSFIESPSAPGLSAMIRGLLETDQSARSVLIGKILDHDPRAAESHQISELRSVIRYLQNHHPGDAGCLFPIFLNHLLLDPGEAIFIADSVPHAYLKGVGLELMANSDNVLRGALTPKHIDIDELIQTCNFDPQPCSRVEPLRTAEGLTLYSPPAEEFELTLIREADITLHPGPGARIALCLSGTYVLSSPQDELLLGKGESVFISAGEELRIKGEGCLAVAGSTSTPAHMLHLIPGLYLMVT